tara:strand:+ start:72 stop:1721 length:1650 start_codon:yes stop_codon:yes gene_type:complete
MGCTAEQINNLPMFNYDSLATEDDGSCIPLSEGCISEWADNYCDSCNVDGGDCFRLGCTFGWADNYDSLATIDDWSCYRMGCTAEQINNVPMFNYDSLATEDDGSCIPLSEGCMSEWADNYCDSCNVDSGDCFRLGCTFSWADNYDSLATIDDSLCYNEGCMAFWADNYDSLATQNTFLENDCFRRGCMSDWADNFDSLATIDDGSCFREGCKSIWAENYNQFATIDDGSCMYYIISQLNQSFDPWNISINLNEGWNMFGYGCPSSMDVAEGLSNYTESIIITKDINGAVFMPEFVYNGIGEFTPGLGYQIKLTEVIEGFRLCDWYVNDVFNLLEENIVSLHEENVYYFDSINALELNVLSLESEIVSLQYELDSINASGCTDSLACNFKNSNLYEDGTCNYPVEGYDCDGNYLLQIGAEFEGGIIFKLDEDECGFPTGTGLVVYPESIGNMDINSAMEFAESFEAEGFDDWYIPSIHQASDIRDAIGGCSPFGNFFDFGGNYWSSTGYPSGSPANWVFNLHYCATSFPWNSFGGSHCCSKNIIVIRSF